MRAATSRSTRCGGIGKPGVAWGLALATLGISAFVVNRRFSAVSVSADSSLEFTLGALLERLADAGGGLNHYLSSAPAPELSRLGPLDFFWNNVLAPFLAPFKLEPYPPSLGNILAREMTGDDTFGPNPTMYMEGLVYFGAAGAVLYCGALGGMLAALRGLFPLLRRLTTMSRAMALVVSCYWAAIALNVTVDLTLIVFGLFNFVFIVIPVLVIASAASRRSQAAGALDLPSAPAGGTQP
jgi:hypothetical protein